MQISKRASLGLAAILAFSPSALLAQDGGLVIEEIIVTAQKRVESLADVPVAVSVVSGDTLDRAQIRDVIDLQQLTPSLVINASTGSTNSILSIRGIGTAGNNTGLEQSVGVFIDGVYRGRVGSAMNDLVDVEQIEVLRGPQSTLFGKNTSAGVISVRTRKPEYEFGGSVEVAAGDFGMNQLRGSVTGPIFGDSMAFRLSGSYFKQDGYFDDPVDGREYNDRDRLSGRAQLLWDIGDATSLRLIGDYTDTQDSCCQAALEFAGGTSAISALLGGPGSVPVISGPADAFSYSAASTPGLGFDNGFIDGGFSAELEHDFSATTLTVIAASRFFETNPIIDSDFQRMDLLTGRVQRQDLEESSFEIRLASNNDSDFEWTVGGFLFDQDIQASDDLLLGTDGRVFGDLLTQAATGGALSFPALEAIFGLPANSIFAAGTGTRNSFDYRASGFAAFAQGTWHINDQWSVTAGLRYSDEEKDSDAVNSLASEPLSNIPLPPPFAGLAAFQVFPATDPYSVSFADDNVTGTFNVSYDPNDVVSLYMRYATGFKSGGINLSRNAGASRPGNPTANPDNAKFDSETVDSFELGLKARLAGGRANVNLAAFSQTLEDFQANSFDGLSFTVRNAAEVESSGLEIDYDWLVTENLRFSGGATFQDMSYSSFPGASPTAAQSAVGITSQDLTGRTPNFVSKVIYTGTLAYSRPITESLLFTASTDVRYRSEYHTGQDLDDRTLQDNVWWVNASIGIEPEDGDWGVVLWVKNATDEKVYNIVFDSPFQAGSYHAFVEQPQTSGITATFRF